jgi:hypothetical protein
MAYNNLLMFGLEEIGVNGVLTLNSFWRASWGQR